jgi:hypothetical protein
MNFTIGLTCAAFLLAVWADARWAAYRPSRLGWRIAHFAAAFVLLQLAAILGGVIVPDDPALGPQLTAAFAVVLPALVYTFVSGLWLLRTLAEAGLARR